MTFLYEITHILDAVAKIHYAYTN